MVLDSLCFFVFFYVFFFQMNGLVIDTDIDLGNLCYVMVFLVVICC